MMRILFRLAKYCDNLPEGAGGLPLSKMVRRFGRSSSRETSIQPKKCHNYLYRSIVAILALGFSLVPALMFPAERNLLCGKISEEQFSRLLLPREKWRPYPKMGEMEPWGRVPADVQADLIHEAEKYLKTKWEPLPATLFLEYARNGDRSNYEEKLFARRQKLILLVMAEVFENKGRFLDDIANGIWVICEESFWGVPAHLGLQRRGPGLPDVMEPTLDLFAAETSSLLAWTIYLMEDRLSSVSPLLPERVYVETQRRILTPALTRDDFWWMGFEQSRGVNNWNPWINSNWLATALILEKDPVRRCRAVYKVMRSLDIFLNNYPADGGCDEGPGYWERAGASLFDCLDMLDSSTHGSIHLYADPLIRNIGQYIYRVYIKDDFFINFADASARLEPEAGLIYRFGKKIDDPVLAGFGAFLTRRQSGQMRDRIPYSGSPLRLLPDLFVESEIRKTTPVEPLLQQSWLPELQVMAARSFPDSSCGFYVAALGGHNAESHNHNDVGNFIVFYDGKPVLIDVGVETYTAKTFSDQRYNIWTMQSAFHNLPTINGVQQMAGREFEAKNVHFAANPDEVNFSLDIARAYPTEALVKTWERNLILRRKRQQLELREIYSLQQLVQPFQLSLMTPLKPDLSRPGEILLSLKAQSPAGPILLRYAEDQFRPASETIEVIDSRLKKVWGERLYRITLESLSQKLNHEYRILLEKAEKNNDNPAQGRQ